MIEFNKKVTLAHSYIKTINLHVEKMTYLKSEVQRAVGTEKEKHYSDEITFNVNEVQNTQTKMKMLMEQLNEEINETKSSDRVS